MNWARGLRLRMQSYDCIRGNSATLAFGLP